MYESIILNLDGRWKLRDFMPGQGLAAGAHLPDYDDTSWHPASVPGDVHTTLVEIKRLSPPFYNMNVETCQWVECQEWWYRTMFEAFSAEENAETRYLLPFDGLDTCATVYLNGTEIGSHRNMEVKDLKQPKPNLTVKITEGSEGKYEVRVTTDTYAYFVKLVVPIEGTKFSDNYFDLFPGQERVTEVWNETGRPLQEGDIAVSCL